MPKSLVKSYIHIVYSTKHRQPFIYPEIEAELHNYLAGICINHECHVIKIGGYDDHVHIVCSLSRKITLMDFVEELKKSSSKWMKTKDPRLGNFYWQNGYFTISVDPADFDGLVDYVANQRKIHDRRKFQKEMLAMLKKNRMEYDERYMWD